MWWWSWTGNITEFQTARPNTCYTILAKNQKIFNFLVNNGTLLSNREQSFPDCGMHNSVWTTGNKQSSNTEGKLKETSASLTVHYTQNILKEEITFEIVSFLINEAGYAEHQWQNPILNVPISAWSKMRHYCIGLVCRYSWDLSIPCCFTRVLPSITVVLVGRNHSSFWW